MHQGRVTPYSHSTSDSWVSANAQGPSQGFQTFGGVIQKPDTDQRDYRVIVLENGLRALLIHDPQADKAAACLTIQVGHLQDPVRTRC
jgi:insulysin